MQRLPTASATRNPRQRRASSFPADRTRSSNTSRTPALEVDPTQRKPASARRRRTASPASPAAGRPRRGEQFMMEKACRGLHRPAAIGLRSACNRRRPPPAPPARHPRPGPPPPPRLDRPRPHTATMAHLSARPARTPADPTSQHVRHPSPIVDRRRSRSPPPARKHRFQSAVTVARPCHRRGNPVAVQSASATADHTGPRPRAPDRRPVPPFNARTFPSCAPTTTSTRPSPRIAVAPSPSPRPQRHRPRTVPSRPDSAYTFCPRPDHHLHPLVLVQVGRPMATTPPLLRLPCPAGTRPPPATYTFRSSDHHHLQRAVQVHRRRGGSHRPRSAAHTTAVPSITTRRANTRPCVCRSHNRPPTPDSAHLAVPRPHHRVHHPIPVHVPTAAGAVTAPPVSNAHAIRPGSAASAYTTLFIPPTTTSSAPSPSTSASAGDELPASTRSATATACRVRTPRTPCRLPSPPPHPPSRPVQSRSAGDDHQAPASAPTARPVRPRQRAAPLVRADHHLQPRPPVQAQRRRRVHRLSALHRRFPVRASNACTLRSHDHHRLARSVAAEIPSAGRPAISHVRSTARRRPSRQRVQPTAIEPITASGTRSSFRSANAADTPRVSTSTPSPVRSTARTPACPSTPPLSAPPSPSRSASAEGLHPALFSSRPVRPSSAYTRPSSEPTASTTPSPSRSPPPR